MSVRRSTEGWAALAPEWAALLDAAQPPAGLFVSPQLLSAWWEVFGDRYALDLTAVRDPDGALIGVLPLKREGAALSPIGDPSVCDYLDVLAAPGRERAVLAALLCHLDAGRCTALDLPGLAEGSPTLAHLPALAAACGWQVRVDQEAVCPTVALPRGWDAYLAGLSGKQRREVRRKMRGLLDGGAAVELEVVDQPEQAESAMEEILRMMAASREDKAAFLTPQTAAFFRALGRNLAPTGWLRYYFLRLDGRRAAGVLCFDQRESLLLYNSGYDPQYRDLAVGLASKVLCVRDAIERGKRRVNFLRGDEPYKHQLGGVDSPVTRLVLTRQPAADA